MSDSKITPDIANSAAKFDRIRRAHQSEVAEDYVEMIYDLIAETGEARCLFDSLTPGEARFVAPAPGAFVALSLGQGFACGLRDAGALECWGPAYAAAAPDPGTAYSAVATSSVDVCAVRAADGALECWSAAGGDASAGPPPAGAFDTVAASAAYGSLRICCAGMYATQARAPATSALRTRMNKNE